MSCTCKDWKENMPKVNAPAMLLHARNPGSGDYDGKVWTYCPWCGKHISNGKQKKIDF